MTEPNSSLFTWVSSLLECLSAQHVSVDPSNILPLSHHMSLYTVGGLLVKHSGDLLSVFYIAALGHFLFFFMAWFVIPESLSAEVMQDLAEQKRVTTAASVERRARRVAAGAKERGRAKAIFLGLVAPIKIFFPRKREVGEPGKGRDWNLTFICVAIGATSVIIVRLLSYFPTAPFTNTITERVPIQNPIHNTNVWMGI